MDAVFGRCLEGVEEGGGRGGGILTHFFGANEQNQKSAPDERATGPPSPVPSLSRLSLAHYSKHLFEGLQRCSCHRKKTLSHRTWPLIVMLPTLTSLGL